MRALLVLLTLAACSDPRMERRVADLEARVDGLQRPTATATATPPGATGPAHRASPAARALYDRAKEAMTRGDHDEARRLLEQMAQVPVTR